MERKVVVLGFVRKKVCRPWLVYTKEEKRFLTPLKLKGKEEEGSWPGFRRESWRACRRRERMAEKIEVVIVRRTDGVWLVNYSESRE